MFVNESGVGVGYISTFDGKNVTRLFSTPMLQVNVEWPENNIISITTKGISSQNGYMYFVDTKTGVWKKIIGPVMGLSTKTSHDGKYVLYSGSSDQYVTTKIFSVASNADADAVIRTLADKCVWGNFNKNIVYCGVPDQPSSGSYPEDWYAGILSSSDRMWQVNATTGEIHLIASLIDKSDRVLNTFNLGLNDKDTFLFFMNKNDLSLWSLDISK